MSLAPTKESLRGVGEARSQSYREHAYRELFRGHAIAISLTATVFAALFFLVTGPESDTLAKPLQRVTYYVCVGTLTWPFGHSLAAALLYFFRGWRVFHVVLAILLGGLFFAANIATVGYAIYVLMVPEGPAPPGWQVFFLRSAVAAVAYYAVVYYVVVTHTRMALSGAGGGAGPERRATADTGSDAASSRKHAGATRSAPVVEKAPELQARFLGRLPAELGREVVYLKVNGHYINVTTTMGSAAVLMRFADAVAELGDAGMQVHRSFWVAYDHIAAVERHAERTVVRLSTGEAVPVSRTFVTAVRELAATR